MDHGSSLYRSVVKVPQYVPKFLNLAGKVTCFSYDSRQQSTIKKQTNKQKTILAKLFPLEVKLSNLIFKQVQYSASMLCVKIHYQVICVKIK